MEKVRILIANHHPIIRGSLRLVLERDPGFEVIGEAATGQEAIAIAEFRHPQIVLLDVKLPQLSGMEVAARLAATTIHRPAIIFVSVLADETYVERALKAGATGYVLGDSAAADLPPAIRTVLKGSVFLSRRIVNNIISEHISQNESAADPLAERNTLIFSLVAYGLTDQEVGQKLGLPASEIRVNCLRAKGLLADLGVSPAILHSVVPADVAHFTHQQG